MNVSVRGRAQRCGPRYFAPAWIFPAFLLLASCTGATSLVQARHMMLTVPESVSVSVLRSGQWTRAEGDFTLKLGDRIAVKRGVARLRIGAGSFAELAGADLRVVAADRMFLYRGHVMVDTRRRMVVAARGNEVETAQGVFRVDKGLSFRAGVYRGSAAFITETGNSRKSLKVDRLRQAVAAAGVHPRTATAFGMHPTDAWDRRYLADAYAIDTYVRASAEEVNRLAGEQPDFMKRAIPPSVLEFAVPYVSKYSAYDVLAAALIASESKHNMARAIDSGVAFWLQGATWGLVAMDFDLSERTLVPGMRQAQATATLPLPWAGHGLANPASSASGSASTAATRTSGGSSSPSPSPSRSNAADPQTPKQSPPQSPNEPKSPPAGSSAPPLATASPGSLEGTVGDVVDCFLLPAVSKLRAQKLSSPRTKHQIDAPRKAPIHC